jgi:hypothetical protein
LHNEGFINTYILKPEKMGGKKKLWVMYHHLKLTITAGLFLPVARWAMKEGTLATVRMCWVIAVLLISPYMRFYREAHSKQSQI